VCAGQETRPQPWDPPTTSWHNVAKAVKLTDSHSVNDTDPAAAAILSEDLARLGQCMLRLETRERQILQLRAAGCKLREIGVDLDLRRNASGKSKLAHSEGCAE
jgi:DNA-directed RNA polymerase specialized sigma24 family protein